MKTLSADITGLMLHLRNCPEDFLRPSSYMNGGVVHTNALLSDTYRIILGNLLVPDDDLPQMAADPTMSGDHLVSIHIACWLFNHPVFRDISEVPVGMERFLFFELPALSQHVSCFDWLRDEDRSEEFIRLALKTCGLLLSGENPEDANDRLEALSTLKRISVLKQSQEAVDRITEIRRKMAEQKAREAANVYGRE
jgi:hypothetical protein